jgi:hypothetical protein
MPSVAIRSTGGGDRREEARRETGCGEQRRGPATLPHVEKAGARRHRVVHHRREAEMAHHELADAEHLVGALQRAVRSVAEPEQLGEAGEGGQLLARRLGGGRRLRVGTERRHGLAAAHVDADRDHGERAAVRVDQDEGLALRRDRHGEAAEAGERRSHGTEDRPHRTEDGIRVELGPARLRVEERVALRCLRQAPAILRVGDDLAARRADVEAEQRDAVRGGAHPFTAPAVRPPIMKRCMAK